MSEPSPRPDHSHQLSKRHYHREAVLIHLEIVGCHQIDRSDQGSSVSDYQPDAFVGRSDVGQMRLHRGRSSGLLMTAHLDLLDGPDGGVEADRHDVIGPLNYRVVGPGEHHFPGEGLGSGLNPDPLSSVHHLPGRVPQIEPSSSHQLGEMLVFGRLFRPLAASLLTELRFEVLVSFAFFFHAFSRSRHWLDPPR